MIKKIILMMIVCSFKTQSETLNNSPTHDQSNVTEQALPLENNATQHESMDQKINDEKVQPLENVAQNSSAEWHNVAHKESFVPQKVSVNDSDNKTKELVLYGEKNTFSLVVLWAPFCGPCVEELKTIHALKDVKNLRVFLLSIDDVRSFSPDFSIPFPLHTLSRASLKEFVLSGKSIVSIPVAFLVNAKGHIMATYQGYTSWQKEKEKIHNLMKEKE